MYPGEAIVPGPVVPQSEWFAVETTNRAAALEAVDLSDVDSALDEVASGDDSAAAALHPKL